ncbi:hypothetical protein B9Z19DRAFT_1093382 [Tuber borchii]|uniref:Secreted protein n=1 Tax=Tuber borchii TaxID=42251 RepID=A0A2T6ZFC9_TUBBO|nr:hypothetical protein B9Z19DRAFT_1093382 [Tuber borchii]
MLSLAGLGSWWAKGVFLLSGHWIGACGWIGEDEWARLGKAIFYSQLNGVCEHDRNCMTPKSKQKARFWRYAITVMLTNVLQL